MLSVQSQNIKLLKFKLEITRNSSWKLIVNSKLLLKLTLLECAQSDLGILIMGLCEYFELILFSL